jgi:hypothetical protein
MPLLHRLHRRLRAKVIALIAAILVSRPVRVYRLVPPGVYRQVS